MGSQGMICGVYHVVEGCLTRRDRCGEIVPPLFWLASALFQRAISTFVRLLCLERN